MRDERTHEIPQSIESEEAALGCFMEDPRTLDTAEELGLRVDDFHRPSHRVIYEVVKHLAERGTLDELAVVNELKARRKLKSVGGTAAVLSLVERVPTTTNAKAYVDDVIDMSILRSLVSTGHEIARLGYEHPDKVKQLVNRSVSVVENMARNAQRTNGIIGDSSSLSEWGVRHIMGETKTRAKWAYPLEKMQAVTGGFGRGQLISIGAQPGVGKSAFKNQILLGLPNEVRVGIINLEMDREDEQVRLLSNLTGIDSRSIWERKLSKKEKEQIVDASCELGERKYEIHQGSKTIEAIRAIQKRHRYDVLMVDHLHRIAGVEDYSTLVRISRTMKSIALDEDCAVISLFQLNKPTDKSDPGELPTINRIKGGPAIQEDSDQVFFLHRNYNQFGYPTANGQIICAKQRGGTSGWALKVKFNERRVAFEEDEG